MGALLKRKRHRHPSEGKTVQNTPNRTRVFEPHEVPAIVKDLRAGPRELYGQICGSFGPGNS
jgi:hypothetical protein